MSVISMMLHPERADSHRLAAELADHLISEGNDVRLSEPKLQPSKNQNSGAP